MSIFDDGTGMDRETAILAMQLAAQSPTRLEARQTSGGSVLG